MCKIMVFGADSFKTLKEVSDTFEYLEEKGGGDGNGLAIFNGQNIILEKGIVPDARRQNSGHQITTTQLAKWFWKYRSLVKWAVFHTRMSTVGVVHEVNCQPFVINDFLFVHNGHSRPEMDLALACQGIDDDDRWSDSYRLSQLLRGVMHERRVAILDSLKDGSAYIVGNYQSLDVVLDKDFTWCLNRNIYTSDSIDFLGGKWYKFERSLPIWRHDKGFWDIPKRYRTRLVIDTNDKNASEDGHYVLANGSWIPRSEFWQQSKMGGAKEESCDMCNAKGSLIKICSNCLELRDTPVAADKEHSENISKCYMGE